MHKLKVLALASLALLCVQAQASLVLQGAQNFGGTGLGAANTILTLQSPNNSTTESGSVGREVGNALDVRVGDFQSGASQTQTRTILSLGVATAADLRVVFNALEPSNFESIRLDNLVLNIFSSTGLLLFTSGTFTGINFPNTFAGAGNSGFVFALDAAQAAAAQAAAFGLGFGSNLIGLAATASNATGGFETFFVASGRGTVPPQQIPVPGSLALVGLGLVGLATLRRLRS